MGSDYDIYIAAPERPQRLLLLLRRAEAGDHVALHRKAAHTRQQRLVMLHRENRRRDEQSHLLAAHDRLERGPESDLGLSEADVPAEKSVHRNL